MSDVYYVARKLRAWVETDVLNGTSAAKLPFYHYIVLRDIVESPNTTVQEISRRLSMAQSMVSKAVAELHRQGFVTSSPDRRDSRRRLLSPATTVHEFVTSRLSKPVEGDLYGLLKGLTPQEQREVLHALEILHSIFKDREDTSGE
ncbi:MarR family transcriptional regulator [Alicyclobacillus kakegawensis]|uniref:MarR family transcriptional regulator n=1 Tax=Alicyclobacillus kakegawensis TaxID=392012 RepID=UPI000B1E72FB|nr:MarR family transcriptional regulator [Alicyclobacillus kakegawensis]